MGGEIGMEWDLLINERDSLRKKNRELENKFKQITEGTNKEYDLVKNMKSEIDKLSYRSDIYVNEKDRALFNMLINIGEAVEYLTYLLDQDKK